MSNTIKYSEGSESLALNKGNWWIGTGDSNKGPTIESGYWNAINPPDGGYTVYLNKETNGPSIHSIADDEKLISFTNKISGNNYTTVAECLVYYQTQDDKLCVNREIENIVTNGLVLNLDAGYVPSYPTTGTTWYDLSGNGNDGTLTNGPTFDSGNGGSIDFDGTNDYVPITCTGLSTTINTVEMWLRWRSGSNGMFFAFLGYDIWQGGGNLGFNTAQSDVYGISSTQVGNLNLVGTTEDNWHHYIFEFTNQVQNNKIYIDTNKQTLSQVLRTTNLTTTRSFSSSISIGAYLSAFYATNSDIVVTRIYNRALSESEITQNYNAQKHRFGL